MNMVLPFTIFFGFCLINEAEVDVFLEFSCFLYDLENDGNLITDSSASLIFFFPWRIIALQYCAGLCHT